YKVAFRIALKAKGQASDRPSHHEQATKMAAPEPTCDCTWRDLRPFLDEALNHLPEKYRAPLVLHYLEGKTVEQAAQELGWPQGTVGGRLNRAKELLRKRLHRGGMVLSGAVCATALEQAGAAVAVPEALLTSTFKATLGMASEKTGAGSGKAAALAAAMLR